MLASGCFSGGFSSSLPTKNHIGKGTTLHLNDSRCRRCLSCLLFARIAFHTFAYKFEFSQPTHASAPNTLFTLSPCLFASRVAHENREFDERSIDRSEGHLPEMMDMLRLWFPRIRSDGFRVDSSTTSRPESESGPSPFWCCTSCCCCGSWL